VEDSLNDDNSVIALSQVFYFLLHPFSIARQKWTSSICFEAILFCSKADESEIRFALFICG
jgi:hypothetical protein